MGGENECMTKVNVRESGSSPRGRGKQPNVTQFTRCQRLIPAWAGKTTSRQAAASLRRAHPRVGGENRPAGVVRPDPRRLIPAWAGKTPGSRRSSVKVRAHPRVGGENAYADKEDVSGTGSSPRGRGKRLGRDRACRRRRLIPAWAGKTTSFHAWGSNPAAHPRVGGENDYFQITDAALAGSSPRGRGKLGEYP